MARATRLRCAAFGQKLHMRCLAECLRWTFGAQFLNFLNVTRAFEGHDLRAHYDHSLVLYSAWVDDCASRAFNNSELK